MTLVMLRRLLLLLVQASLLLAPTSCGDDHGAAHYVRHIPRFSCGMNARATSSPALQPAQCENVPPFASAPCLREFRARRRMLDSSGRRTLREFASFPRGFAVPHSPPGRPPSFTAPAPQCRRGRRCRRWWRLRCRHSHTRHQGGLGTAAGARAEAGESAGRRAGGGSSPAAKGGPRKDKRRPPAIQACAVRRFGTGAHPFTRHSSRGYPTGSLFVPSNPPHPFHVRRQTRASSRQ